MILKLQLLGGSFSARVSQVGELAPREVRWLTKPRSRGQRRSQAQNTALLPPGQSSSPGPTAFPRGNRSFQEALQVLSLGDVHEQALA